MEVQQLKRDNADHANQDMEVQQLKRDNADLNSRGDMLQGMVSRLTKGIQDLRQATQDLRQATLDLKCRSMGDNLSRNRRGISNSHCRTPMKHVVIDLGLPKTTSKELGIDRCHRLGRKGKKYM